eukprot:453547-Prorocentrum_minimum.AAC.2
MVINKTLTSLTDSDSSGGVEEIGTVTGEAALASNRPTPDVWRCELDGCLKPDYGFKSRAGLRSGARPQCR